MDMIWDMIWRRKISTMPSKSGKSNLNPHAETLTWSRSKLSSNKERVRLQHYLKIYPSFAHSITIIKVRTRMRN